MPLEQRQSLDPARQVDHILAQHYISQGRVEGALKVVQNAAQSKIASGTARSDLSKFLIQRGDSSAVKSAAVSANDLTDRNGLSSSLRTASLAKAKLATVDVSVQKDAERALVLAPWDTNNKLALAYVRSKLSGGT